jgi:ribonuclease P protein subunit POP4
MQLSPGNLIHHEIIGLETEVVDSSNFSQIGIKGKVIDETKNTLSIQLEKGITKIIAKSHTHFLFNLPHAFFITTLLSMAFVSYFQVIPT